MIKTLLICFIFTFIATKSYSAINYIREDENTSISRELGLFDPYIEDTEEYDPYDFDDEEDIIPFIMPTEDELEDEEFE